MQISIQNTPVEPIYTLKKYLENLEKATELIKIEIEDEVDVKDPGQMTNMIIVNQEKDSHLVLNSSTDEANEIGSTHVKEREKDIKREKISFDATDEFCPDNDKLAYDKILSKKFNMRHTTVMIPRDVPITPSANTATFFVNLIKDKNIHASMHRDNSLETKDEVENEINILSYKCLTKGNDDSSSQVNNCDMGTENTVNNDEKLMEKKISSSSMKMATSETRGTQGIKKKKRRKEMFVFTNVKGFL